MGKGNAKPAAAKDVWCDIDVGDAGPVAQRCRKVSPKFLGKLFDFVKGLLSAGLTRLMVCPMPVVTELLDGLGSYLCKQVCAFYFTDLGDGQFSCKKCGQCRKQTPGTGYTNLMDHLSAKHKEFAAEFAEAQRSTSQSLDAFGFVDDTTTNMYLWLNWIVERNLPLCEVEDPTTRSIVKMEPTTARTIKVYMQHVAGRVGSSIPAEMGSTFGVMFDGWTNNSIHFLGVYPIYMKGDKRCQRLLAVSPMHDGQTADGHIGFLSRTLTLYDKTLAMIRFLVADNCSTNQCVATQLGVPPISCASHRFNLAVNCVISEYQDQVDQIQNLMINLRHVNNAAALARVTDLKPLKANATRWSSVYKMVKRYVEIREAIMTVSAVEELVPRGAAHRRIQALLTKLEELDSVCVKLQAEKRTLGDVRLLFDACVAKYPAMAQHLLSGASIVHSPLFESAVAKLINDVPLAAAEQKAHE
ncbi:hypothetical protein P43SY_004968 [Pythium insidiosum]|uniref:BED-type domain-containing protein n=1 Tax=Pythium insidiosum TaxID=114742 RepID=A0AAD5LC31_PYTIN|nr:hypothetical protein P43SY_004968 [Pythium insidiosum]